MQIASHELGKQLDDAVFAGTLTLADAVKIFSRAVLVAAIKAKDGNLAETARNIGVKRTSLTEMVQRRFSLRKITRHGRYHRKARPIKEDPVCEECRCVFTSDQECQGCVFVSDSIALAVGQD